MTAELEFCLTAAVACVSVWMCCWVALQARGAWRDRESLQDLSVQWLAGAGLVYLLAGLALQIKPHTNLPWAAFAHYAQYLGLQLLVVCVGLFLLLTARVPRRWTYALLAVQAVVGCVALNWQPWALATTFCDFEHSPAYPVWATVNLSAAFVVAGVLFVNFQNDRSVPNVLALMACLLGLLLCAEPLLIGNRLERPSTLPHAAYDAACKAAYALLLSLVWRLTSADLRRLSAPVGTSALCPSSANMSLLTDFTAAADLAEIAVTQERRRIGQYLHHGVGSQLMSILSSLDSNRPSTRPVALALEQCLVDLKMTVDALDASNDSVLDVLGRLRYRVQHSLDKLGIKMSWRVEFCEELQAVRGENAVNVLRIAQEALANAMAHSRATAVEVVCWHAPDSHALVLEVRDNGRGIAQRSDYACPPDTAFAVQAGRGLANMRLRAKSAGGELTVSSKAGCGTRVRLTLKTPPAAPEAATSTCSSTPSATRLASRNSTVRAL